MISFDFEYYRPSSINEAVNTYQNLKSLGRQVIYYAGGTEIISMARINAIHFDAVIDIKEIPECNVLQAVNNQLAVGAAVTLTKISEASMFPLLTAVVKSTADHTSRDKITIGGNICGAIPYHEALLPFLLCDSQAVLAGRNGTRTVPINQIYNQKLQMENGEFLVQLITAAEYLNLTYEFVRRTKMEIIDYPLLTLALIKKDNSVKVAFSGVCSFPFRSKKIEEDLNNKNAALDERINSAMAHLPGPLLSDLQGSAEYRNFILKNVLSDTMQKIGVM